ncbi:MAG: methyltransferase [Alphaproteobacteria bacterium]|nr:methyltransferase [Alphaproteobacteria bacterium]
MDSSQYQDLPAVTALLNYLVPTAEKPFNLTYDPPPGTARTNTAYAGHPFAIHDARPIAGALSLDREGFALVRHETAIRDFDDEAALRSVYYPEAEALVARVTGARRVLVFDHTIRRRFPHTQDRTAGLPRQPVPRVHNDYTVKSGPQRVRDLLGDEADDLLSRRFAIVNVWRPIRGPLLDTPLAVADARSVPFSDFIPSDLVYPDRRGETYAVAFNPAHRWFYVPAMRQDEALLIKCYDSAEDDRARFSPHSAFEDPTTPEDALPRESIELRTLAFFA